MAKRMILMLVLAGVVVAGLGFVKFRQIQTAVAQNAGFQPPPEAVTTVVAKRETWPATVDVIGTAVAVQGVTVSADLPGTVDRIAFESGKAVKVGDVLVELDTRQERAQLAAMEAQVDLGQYLSAGEAIVSLQSLNPIYVNFGVPQQTAVQVRVGRTLRVSSNDVGGIKFSGRVTALDSVVNEGTRNVQVQATLANPGGKLRPGMFVQVEITTGTERPVIALPTSAINYAPYGDSVYVVSELKDPKGNTYRGVRQQFVKLEGSRGDQVAVISGVNPGDEIVRSGVFKLRNGAAVQVNNKVQPGNSPAPKPEDS